MNRLTLCAFFFITAFFSFNAYSQNTVDLSEWTKKLEWGGDLRYRLARSQENVDQDRNFQQLRVRLGLRADVNPETQVHLRLATGTSSISTNQTLGDSKDPGMARRSFGLDLAFIDWNFMKGGRLWLGRAANPFWSPAKAQTLFDGDLAFEGLAFKWEPKWSSSSAFVNSGAFMISENYAAPDDVVDTGLAGFEVGYSHKTPVGTITGRVGSYYYLNIQDKQINVLEKDGKVDAYSYPLDRYRGNTVYPNDPLLPPDQRKYYFQNKYVLSSLGVEWKHKFGSSEATAFYEMVKNTEISDQNTATELGLNLKWGRTSLGFAMVEKQTDSVVGAFTDSDTNGGGTDNKGTRLSLSYQLSDNSQVGYNQYQAKRGVNSTERDFRSSQLDFIASF
ncbi:MAG: putative porin [Bdellovibrio sp.]